MVEEQAQKEGRKKSYLWVDVLSGLFVIHLLMQTVILRCVPEIISLAYIFGTCFLFFFGCYWLITRYRLKIYRKYPFVAERWFRVSAMVGIPFVAILVTDFVHGKSCSDLWRAVYG